MIKTKKLSKKIFQTYITSEDIFLDFDKYYIKRYKWLVIYNAKLVIYKLAYIW